MQHSFDVEIAQKYGVNAAIILNNLEHWIKKNEANGINNFDGNFWTFNSRRAYREIFPYMGERQINTAFQKLIEGGIIETGNYNKSAYDRTLWYALTEKGKAILHYDGFHSDVLSNGKSENVEPIPYINTNKNTDINTDIKHIVEFLNEKAGTNYKATSKTTKESINARIKEGFTVADFETVINKKCEEWLGTEWEKFLRPSTLFGTKFEGYLNAKTSKRKEEGYANSRKRSAERADEKWGRFGQYF